jgi:hypothetical protein
MTMRKNIRGEEICSSRSKRKGRKKEKGMERGEEKMENIKRFLKTRGI